MICNYFLEIQAHIFTKQLRDPPLQFCVFFFLQKRILRKNLLCLLPGMLHDLQMLCKISHIQFRDPMLSGAEDISRTTSAMKNPSEELCMISPRF